MSVSVSVCLCEDKEVGCNFKQNGQKRGLLKGLTFWEKLEGGEEGSIPGTGNSKCTSPEVGPRLVWASKKASVGEAE